MAGCWLAPGSWDAYEWNDFNESRLLHLAICRKALNSLTWDIWLSLINNHVLMFRLPALSLLQNFYVTWLLPLPPWSSSPWVTWNAVSCLEVLNLPLNKAQISTLKLWIFFKSTGGYQVTGHQWNEMIECQRACYHRSSKDLEPLILQVADSLPCFSNFVSRHSFRLKQRHRQTLKSL